MKKNCIIFFDEKDFEKVANISKSIGEDSLLVHIDIYDAKYMSKGENIILQEKVSDFISENYFHFEKIRSNDLQKTVMRILERNFETIYLPEDDKRKIDNIVKSYNDTYNVKLY